MLKYQKNGLRKGRVSRTFLQTNIINNKKFLTIPNMFLDAPLQKSSMARYSVTKLGSTGACASFHVKGL